MPRIVNKNFELYESQKLKLGDNQESELYYDGTDPRFTTPVRGIDAVESYHLATKSQLDGVGIPGSSGTSGTSGSSGSSGSSGTSGSSGSSFFWVGHGHSTSDYVIGNVVYHNGESW